MSATLCHSFPHFATISTISTIFTMSDLTKHLIQSIEKDTTALFKIGAISDNNRLVIQAILENPSKDHYHPPAYTTGSIALHNVTVRSREPSSSSIADKPFLPPRPIGLSEPSRAFPSKPSTIEQSPPQYQPAKPERPPAPTVAKPINNDKLSSQYRSDQANREEKKNEFANRVGSTISNSASHGLGFGVGMGIARRLI